jgi:hypothetical protein
MGRECSQRKTCHLHQGVQLRPEKSSILRLSEFTLSQGNIDFFCIRICAIIFPLSVARSLSYVLNSPPIQALIDDSSNLIAEDPADVLSGIVIPT